MILAVRENDADIYLSFFGDAFASKKVNNQLIMKLLESMLTIDAEYCNLVPQHVVYAKN